MTLKQLKEKGSSKGAEFCWDQLILNEFNIKHLSLSGNLISDGFIIDDVFEEEIVQMKRSKVLSNDDEDHGGKLESLDMSANPLSSEGVKSQVIPIMRINVNTLTHLNLRKIKLIFYTAKVFCYEFSQVLPEMKVLKYLNLAENSLEEEGLTLLGPALRSL
jgi:hypothetical protein